MPTNPAKARHLLKSGKAKVVRRTPFTIQLTVATGEAKQDITLGVDAGSVVVGLSATTENEVLFEAELQLRNDIVKLLATRATMRRVRRSRKTRYRQARFLNRMRPKGWLPPSIVNKINGHSKVIALVKKLLPITKVIIEVAQFDIQKINNPDIAGVDYQQGEQLGFWNVREYVLFRDGHKCQGIPNCKGQILNVHHIESRQTGGNAPNNLVTLCEDCHKNHHSGKIILSLKRGKSFKHATFMGILRKSLYEKELKGFPNTELTYGYITKNTRITNSIPKSHIIDARCISGQSLTKGSSNVYSMKQVRGQNRQLHKATINKGGTRKSNKAPKFVYGFQLFDKVKYQGRDCFIFGRRTSGNFDIRLLDGTKITAGVTYKKLTLVERATTLLIEGE